VHPARRNLMTGTSARTHGDRVFSETLEMPRLPTLAQAFSEAGYQTFAVGKLHVYPQRDRIGFDEVILNEEARHHLGLLADDYELFLADNGYSGQWLSSGLSLNAYIARPWHLPEHLHPTNWTARQMCRAIFRRDPRKPAFWYVSFNHPHPPLSPPQSYFDMYRDEDIPEPKIGDWARDFAALPHALKLRWQPELSGLALRLVRRAFYGLCTHIDHQIRLVIGTLREEKLLDNTAIMLLCDHGDMLGNHHFTKKALMYEDSVKIPMFLVPPAGDKRVGHHCVDDRLVELVDAMPTLLELAGIPVPASCEGISLLSERRREYLYAEHYENPCNASRMVRDARYKLIYYPAGNRVQLFDLQEDPDELHDLSGAPSLAAVRERLSGVLVANMYGGDLAWVKDGKLMGVPEPPFEPPADRGLNAQRGMRLV
jgi:arylsulfatase A-like enzyme